ncbi:unnamed protein product [Fusarium graminearum]|nr:unnamed protein product [Fusarium graminearum]CAF3584265.1 unnamed protein product [Fusarium graminearum]CAG1980897.1 unnamed protein product [Fusarium graminearum]CAG1995299.1 unnamed protein product [Fusarium graminearum]CAG2004544.1 unnamed protein product [Fusarium graminearum]
MKKKQKHDDDLYYRVFTMAKVFVEDSLHVPESVSPSKQLFCRPEHIRIFATGCESLGPGGLCLQLQDDSSFAHPLDSGSDMTTCVIGSGLAKKQQRYCILPDLGNCKPRTGWAGFHQRIPRRRIQFLVLQG